MIKNILFFWVLKVGSIAYIMQSSVRKGDSMDFLLNKDLRYVCVDVETDTTPTDDALRVGFKKSDFGLSVLARPVWVSFFAEGYDPVVIRFSEENKAFIRQVLTSPGRTIVGHNVLFDLRQLGVWCDFLLPQDVRVWDTYTMSVRFLMSSSDSSGGLGSSLDVLTRRFSLRTPYYCEAEHSFYSDMKRFRVDFDSFYNYLEQALFDNTLSSNYIAVYEAASKQSFLNADLDVLYETLIQAYVSLDTVYTYRLFKYQLSYLQSVSKQDTKLPGGVIVPMWHCVMDLVKKELKFSRISANVAIRGVKVDLSYLNSQIQHYEEELRKASESVMAQGMVGSDFAFYCVLHRINMMIGSLQFNEPLNKMNNRPYYMNQIVDWQKYLNIEMLLDAIDCPEQEREGCYSAATRLYHFFCEVFEDDINDRFRSTAAWRKRFQEVMLPYPMRKLQLRQYLNLHSDYNDLETRYRHKVRLDYYAYIVSQTDYLTAQELISKNKFKPYYLFVACNLPFPSDAEIHYNPSLVTNRIYEHLDAAVAYLATKREIEQENDSEDEGEFFDRQEIDNYPPYARVAFEVDGWSTGKKALPFYLPKQKLEDGTDNPAFLDHPAHKYQLAITYEALLERHREILKHASLDGRLHSITPRITGSGRCASRLPNIQNIDMSRYHGYLVGDDGFELAEADYANAENKSGAMISGDNAFAMATEGGDFHLAQAKIYWASIWDTLTPAERKKMRNEGKKVTFGGAYGAGAKKIAVMIGSTEQEARAILDARDRAYPQLTKAKQDAQAQFIRIAKNGYAPAFVSLWDGSRVTPHYLINDLKDGQQMSQEQLENVINCAYKTWNYLQQGAVAQMVMGAIVDFTDFLENGGYKSYVALNVHDSIIVALKIEEADEVLPKLFEIMGEQVPLSLRQRTIPPIHFVSEMGPENARKWGYRHNQPYGLPLNVFYNRWGKFELEDGQTEAPTWVVNVAAGETLENEIAAMRIKQQIEEQGVHVSRQAKWHDVEQRLREYASHIDEFKYIDGVFTLRYLDKNNQERCVEGLRFSDYLTAVDILVSRGYDRRLLTQLPSYEEYIQFLENMK